jgi:ribosome-associated toxin RatA of RatAB toxin-antitoxin module
MKSYVSSTLAFVLLSTVACFSKSAPALDFTKQEIQQLAKGELIRKPLPQSRTNGFYGGAGFAIINASPEAVWKALSDYASYPQIFPRTVEAKELSRKDDNSLVRMVIGYKILSIEYALSMNRDWEKRTLTFSLAENKPHDIDTSKGYWKLFPQADGRTLVAYAVAVQIPAGIVTFLGDSVERSLESSLIGLPKYLKKWVEKSQAAAPGVVAGKKIE